VDIGASGVTGVGAAPLFTCLGQIRRDTNVTREAEHRCKTTRTVNKRNACSGPVSVGTGRSPMCLLYFMLYYDI
jgi:hypothetical protein